MTTFEWMCINCVGINSIQSRNTLYIWWLLVPKNHTLLHHSKESIARWKCLLLYEYSFCSLTLPYCNHAKYWINWNNCFFFYIFHFRSFERLELFWQCFKAFKAFLMLQTWKNSNTKTFDAKTNAFKQIPSFIFPIHFNFLMYFLFDILFDYWNLLISKYKIAFYFYEFSVSKNKLIKWMKLNEMIIIVKE